MSIRTLGLSDERVEELVGWIQTWLQDDCEASEKQTNRPLFPYHLRDDFLSPAERHFYYVLQTAASDWAIITTKVSLGDLFYVQTGDATQNRIYRNKIDRKHVDFLLCDPRSLRPILGIELDDRSHRRPDRQERARFVDGVFGTAALPLLHIPVRRAYQVEQLRQQLHEKAIVDTPFSVASEPEPAGAISTQPGVPSCPQCAAPMCLRTAKNGANKGNAFWGCTNYPDCRGIRPYQV